MQTVAKGQHTWILEREGNVLAYRSRGGEYRGTLPLPPNSTAAAVDGAGCLHLFSAGDSAMHISVGSGEDWRRQTLLRTRPGDPKPTHPLLWADPYPAAVYLLRLADRDVIGCCRAPGGRWQTQRLAEAPSAQELTPLCIAGGCLIAARKTENGWLAESYDLYGDRGTEKLWSLGGRPAFFTALGTPPQAVWQAGNSTYRNGTALQLPAEAEGVIAAPDGVYAVCRQNDELVMANSTSLRRMPAAGLQPALYVTAAGSTHTWLDGNFDPVQPEARRLVSPAPAAATSPAPSGGDLTETLRAQATLLTRLRETAQQNDRRLFTLEARLKALEQRSAQAADLQREVTALKAAMTVLETLRR